jgi:hypothetical protein
MEQDAHKGAYALEEMARLCGVILKKSKLSTGYEK